jgi:hypothetical protein
MWCYVVAVVLKCHASRHDAFAFCELVVNTKPDVNMSIIQFTIKTEQTHIQKPTQQGRPSMGPMLGLQEPKGCLTGKLGIPSLGQNREND